MRFLPRIVRRAVLLRRARDLFAAGDPQGVLSVLSDGVFSGDSAALELAREAQAALDRISAPSRGAIPDLLARLREERLARGSSTTEPDQRDGARVLVAGASPGARALFRLVVDDAGEFLAAVGTAVTLGHASSTLADLVFLAHVEREHARLLFTNDFHAGPTWRIVPLGSARIEVDGRIAGPAGAVVQDGARVVLGPNLAFRFSAADLSSSSIVLELEGGWECAGATRVLLFVPGPDGRVTIGARGSRTIQVGDLEDDVTLEVVEGTAAGEPQRLVIACALGVERGRRPDGRGPTSLSTLVPPGGSERFSFALRPRDRAPFEIVIAPVGEGRA